MCSATVEITTGMPLPTRKSILKIRWFETSFRAQMAATSAQTGLQYELSDLRLVDAFLSWHQAFDTQKPASRMVRRSHVGFAAGMMFHELLRKRPVLVFRRPAKDDPKNPALIWPEEYLYASYCNAIRQVILDQDFWLGTQKKDWLDDPTIWQKFSDNIARDRDAAIAFLERIAHGPKPSPPPLTANSDSGLGNRLWKLTDGPSKTVLPNHASSLSAGTGLRLITDNSPLCLPTSTRLVLIAFEGVAAQTEGIDAEELCALLDEYNVKLTPDQTHDRFFGQPVSAVVTYVGQQTGQICPSSFVTKLDQRLIERDRLDLELRPGIRALLQCLKEAGIEFGIVSHSRRSRIEAAQKLPALAALQSFGMVHMLNPKNQLATVSNNYSYAPCNTILIDANSTGISMAQNAFITAFGFSPKGQISHRNALRLAGAQVVLSNLKSLVC